MSESNTHFKFKLGQKVTITISGQSGTVVARCDYDNAENAYRLRYTTPDGNATERFWTESSLS